MMTYDYAGSYVYGRWNRSGRAYSLIANTNLILKIVMNDERCCRMITTG
ncbi:MAG: hypothetical protein ACLU4N_21005 [Butyricimonas faecihominis]